MKRFTETQKWEDPWFRRLAPELKLLWHWLLDKCDGAGIIEPDIELASFQIGFQYPVDILSKFDGRVTKLECGKYFIPKFISYQYGNLSRECKAHNPIFSSLEKHGLKGYPYPIHTLQEKEKEKDTETDQEQETVQAAKKAKSEWNPTPEQIRINGWFARRNSTVWSEKEIKAFKAIPHQTILDGIEDMSRFYTSGHKTLRHDILTLLNNWTGEMDRAFKWESERAKPKDAQPKL